MEIEKNTITVGTILFKDIFTFKNDYFIKIPDYQRPYIWNADKVETLIDDLQYYLENNNSQEYYMGSILFYRQNNNFEIIDGQQRLTTLLILDEIANTSRSILRISIDKIRFFFNSPVSKKNIIEVKNFLNNYKFDWLHENWNKVVSNLVFSVIISKQQDDAFSFFESQNNRGVKLGAADYLKSFHLRELREEEGKQAVFAKQWDANNTEQFLNYLFNKVIWRGRSWQGNNVWYESQDDVLQEFQKKTRNPEFKNHVKIFPMTKNQIADTILYDENDGIILKTSPITLKTHAINYPFALRQPIEKGIGFFLYSERYTAMYHYLFNIVNTYNNELDSFKEFYKAVYIQSRMSDYLQSLFRLCIILYFDKFESKKIGKFAKYLDYYVGSYRIKLSSVYDKTVVKILKEKKQNLLDIITQAFIPEQIFDFIFDNTDDTIYMNEKIPLKNDNGQLINKVQSNYKRALLNYYNKNNLSSLKALKEWIK